MIGSLANGCAMTAPAAVKRATAVARSRSAEAPTEPTSEAERHDDGLAQLSGSQFDAAFLSRRIHPRLRRYSADPRRLRDEPVFQPRPAAVSATASQRLHVASPQRRDSANRAALGGLVRSLHEFAVKEGRQCDS
jgi:hypothetical protein